MYLSDNVKKFYCAFGKVNLRDRFPMNVSSVCKVSRRYSYC